VKPENVAEHSYWVILYAYLIIMLECNLGDVAPEAQSQYMLLILQYAMIHDVNEALTGDFPFLVKRLLNKENLKNIECAANSTIMNVNTFIEEKNSKPIRYLMNAMYKLGENYATGELDSYIKKVVKGADLLDVYLYTISEAKVGNFSFSQIQRESIKLMRDLHLSGLDLILNELEAGQGVVLTEGMSHL
jgi:5'-deoxynucleotidase YfbR-like HD superfamily hydrolase